MKYGSIGSSNYLKTTYRKVTTTKLTSGSGTYNVPAGVRRLVVKMVGGGGGGQGSAQTAWGPLGTNGSDTTFGTSLLVATGGWAGNIQGGFAGSAVINAPAIELVKSIGSQGGTGMNDNETASEMKSGFGGSTFLSGGSSGVIGANAGRFGIDGTGSGGGGGGLLSTTQGTFGAGGGGGGYLEAAIENPEPSYPYSVGVGGVGGAAGTLGYVGGNGGSGVIIIEEHY